MTTLYEPKNSSKIILVNPKKEILLYLRDKNSKIVYAGYWDLFGGLIEKGESAMEAIKREVREELNIIVNQIEFMEKINVVGDPNNFWHGHNVSLFKGKVDSEIGKIVLSEGQRARYFKLDDLHKLKFPFFYREFIFKNKDKLYN